MSFKLIHIRFIQLSRALKEGGFGTVLLPIIIALLSFASFKVYQNQLYGLLLIIIILIFCVALQMARKDNLFAQLQIPNWHVQMFTEYVLLTLPFSITSLFTSNYYYLPILLFMLWFVPYIRYSAVKKVYFKNISKIFHAAHSIEWISGFRKSFFSILPLSIFAIAFCWVRILPLLLLWLITTTIIAFYSECEPLSILKARHTNAKKFVNQKISKHSNFLMWFYLPVLFLNSLFHPDFIAINILFLLIQLALLTFAIVLKYSSYVPNQINVAGNVTLSIVSIGSIIPFMLPLPIIFAAVYYKKAINNLNNYFNDTD